MLKCLGRVHLISEGMRLLINHFWGRCLHHRVLNTVVTLLMDQRVWALEARGPLLIDLFDFRLFALCFISFLSLVDQSHHTCEFALGALNELLSLFLNQFQLVLKLQLCLILWYRGLTHCLDWVRRFLPSVDWKRSIFVYKMLLIMIIINLARLICSIYGNWWLIIKGQLNSLR